MKNYDFDEYINKHDRLIFDLKKKRIDFAEIGTNKAKRRLNKLSGFILKFHIVNRFLGILRQKIKICF